MYSILYFARALAANLGIIASSLILPNYDWLGCFIFFGVLTILSFGLLLIFNAKPIPATSRIKRPIGMTPGSSSPGGRRQLINVSTGAALLPSEGKAGGQNMLEESWNVSQMNQNKLSARFGPDHESKESLN